MSGLRHGRRRTIATAAPVAPLLLSGAEGEDTIATLERAIGTVADAVDEAGTSTYLADHDLIVGQNTINHGLNRKPEMVYVTAHDASSSFGWAWDPEQPGNPRPAQITQVAVTGVPMRARVEVR